MSQKPLMKETEQHWEKFETLEKQAQNPAWAFLMRKAGMARFAELGFPTIHDEDWRFTNVAPIARLPFKPVYDPTPEALPAATLRQLVFATIPGPRLVFLNGHFLAEHSRITGLPAGVKVSNLASALEA